MIWKCISFWIFSLINWTAWALKVYCYFFFFSYTLSQLLRLLKVWPALSLAFFFFFLHFIPQKENSLKNCAEIQHLKHLLSNIPIKTLKKKSVSTDYSSLNLLTHTEVATDVVFEIKLKKSERIPYTYQMRVHWFEMQRNCSISKHNQLLGISLLVPGKKMNSSIYNTQEILG